MKAFLLILAMVIPWGLSAQEAKPAKRPDKAQIRANFMQVDKKTGKLLLKGKVHVRQESTGASLEAEQLELTRDLKSDEITQGRAQGQVVAKDPQREMVLQCDLAVFERSSSRAELKGNVQVDSPEFHIKGEELQYQYDEGKGRITAKPGELVEVRFFRVEGQDASQDATPDDSPSVEQDQPVITPSLAAAPPSAELPARGSLEIDLDDPSADVRLDQASQKAVKERQKPSQDKSKREVMGQALEVLLDEKAGKITLQGQVKVVDLADNSVLLAQRAEVLLDENREAEEVIASGDFNLNQTGRISSAQRAHLAYKNRIVTLLGQARVMEEDKLAVESSRIEMFMEVERGIIKGQEDAPVKLEIPLK